MTVVVPRGTMARDSSNGEDITDSMCMCASMKPGHTILPVQSASVRPEYSPSPAMYPSATATSHTVISFVKTFTTPAFFRTRSAGSRPAATAARRARVCASAIPNASLAFFLLYYFIRKKKAFPAARCAILFRGQFVANL